MYEVTFMHVTFSCNLNGSYGNWWVSKICTFLSTGVDINDTETAHSTAIFNLTHTVFLRSNITEGNLIMTQEKNTCNMKTKTKQTPFWNHWFLQDCMQSRYLRLQKQEQLSPNLRNWPTSPSALFPSNPVPFYLCGKGVSLFDYFVYVVLFWLLDFKKKLSSFSLLLLILSSVNRLQLFVYGSWSLPIITLLQFKTLII